MSESRVQVIPGNVARISGNGLEPNRSWKEDTNTPDEGQIALCVEFIRTRCLRTKRVRPYSSYYLKHLVEEWTKRRDNPSDAYIANGAFIEAARREGFTIKRLDARCVNAKFNMDALSIANREKKEAEKRFNAAQHAEERAVWARIRNRITEDRQRMECK